jgi:hypothetical protein
MLPTWDALCSQVVWKQADLLSVRHLQGSPMSQPMSCSSHHMHASLQPWQQQLYMALGLPALVDHQFH